MGTKRTEFIRLLLEVTINDFFKVLKKITFYDTISMKMAKKASRLWDSSDF